MVLTYLHILKKIYIKNYIVSESDGWLLGGYAFFLISHNCILWNFPQRYSPQRLNINYRSQHILVPFKLYL
jgi:hypothetical protein